MTATAKQTRSALPPPVSGVRGGVSARATANAFPKSARLLKHAGFQQVYETGRKQFSTSMTFFYLLREGRGQAQVGLTVGRALGGAVDRNRIKRRMRDVVRHSLAALESALAARQMSAEIVINPKRVALAADIAKLRDEVTRGFAVIAAGAGATRPR